MQFLLALPALLRSVRTLCDPKHRTKLPILSVLEILLCQRALLSEVQLGSPWSGGPRSSLQKGTRRPYALSIAWTCPTEFRQDSHLTSTARRRVGRYGHSPSSIMPATSHSTSTLSRNSCLHLRLPHKGGGLVLPLAVPSPLSTTHCARFT